MREINDRHAFAATFLRGEIPNMQTVLLDIVQDFPMKREEIYQALQTQYGIGRELANDLATVELSNLVDKGKLVRPKKGYYKRA